MRWTQLVSWKLTLAVFVLWAIGLLLPLMAGDAGGWLLAIGAGLTGGIAVGLVWLGVELSITGGLPLSPALETRVRYLRRWVIGLLALAVFFLLAVWDLKQVALAVGTSVQSAIWVSVLALIFGHERRSIDGSR